METVHEEEVLESLDCNGCGKTLVGYAADGEKIFEIDYCPHANLCGPCERETVFDEVSGWGPPTVSGCPKCFEGWMEQYT